MFSKRKLNLNSLNGVASNSTATLRLPIGVSLHQIDLTFGGDLTVAKVNAIRYLVNGDIRESWKSGTQLQDFNKFLRLSTSTTKLKLPFERKGLLSLDHREVTVVGTGLSKEGDPNHISTHTLEIDIDSSSSTPSITANAWVSDASLTGLIRQTRHFTYNALAAGEFEISDLPRKAGRKIDRIYFKCWDPSDDSAVEVTDAKLVIDSEIKFQRTNADNEDAQTDGIRTPQTGYFVFDPSEEGDGDEFIELAGIQDMTWTLNLPEDATVLVSVEYISRLDDKF